MSETRDFKECLDTIFLIQDAAIQGCGEDNFYCAHCSSSAVISVFDGCGGLGSRTYDTFEGHTGAYMASRVVSGAVRDWYHKEYRTVWKNGDALCRSLRKYLDMGYEACSRYAVSNLRIRGSMVRDFPTTAAMALVSLQHGEIILHVLWAGDSRIYLIDDQGLAQLTEDDTDSADAMENLLNDGALTNLISSDGRYQLHYRSVKLEKPSIVIAATDGCFGYLPTPMDFEYLVLNTLIQSQSPEIFKNKMRREFQKYAGDDFTFGYMSFFCEDFRTAQSLFHLRLQEVFLRYIKPMEENGREEKAEILWKKYKQNYERFTRGSLR